MPYGYQGRVLHVDLTNGTMHVEEPEEGFFRRYMGGRAVVAHYLLRLTRPGIDPLGPDNVLVVAPGLITGAAVSGQGRNGVGAKSPLTNGFGNAEGGGYFGSELKRAGFDALVFTGRAPHPVYLWIHDGAAELRDARPLWGAEVAEAEALIHQDVGDKGARTCLIGPAGERLVRYACVVNDLSHFAGRTGIGAVFGSKHLKGIAVRAHKPLPVFDPKGLRALVDWLNAHLDLVATLHDVGTAGGLRALHLAGGLPTFNFQEGAFAGNEQITGQTMRDTILVKRDTCYACAVRCKRVVEVTDGPIQVHRQYGGPEYESLAAFGSNCGVDNLIVLAKANERSAALGLDSISCGASIAFAMEAFERGLLTKDDLGGLDLRFGNAEAVLQAIELIARREGVGDLLAEGVARMAERLGPAAEEFALVIKGQELPMHEPRIKHGLGLGYTVSPTGADHQHNMHDTIYASETPFLHRLRDFKDFKTIDVHGYDENKLEVWFHHTTWRHFLDCVGMCHFLPYPPKELAKAIRALTGWDVDHWELLQVGERGATMARVYNLREGLGPETDAMPKRFFKEFRNNNSATGKPLDPDALRAAQQWYYRKMGWDERGVPTPERLKALGIEWTQEALAAY
ncbi:MAG TPA: aldehyde ferredoxin oxidoreductase family protein [Chloroflexota bacterium]